MYLVLNKNNYGQYPPLQTSEGVNTVVFPDKFIPIFYPSDKYAAGFVDVVVDDYSVVSECIWNDSDYNNWLNNQQDFLLNAKTEKITKSKIDLSSYLEEHPFLWTDGEYYSITAEKQQQLTSKLFSATSKKLAGIPYTLTWNSTGEVCKEWTLEELSALAYAIEDRVTALVTYQQKKEVEIRNATSQEELDAIVIDYDEVN